MTFFQVITVYLFTVSVWLLFGYQGVASFYDLAPASTCETTSTASAASLLVLTALLQAALDIP